MTSEARLSTTLTGIPWAATFVAAAWAAALPPSAPACGKTSTSAYGRLTVTAATGAGPKGGVAVFLPPGRGRRTPENATAAVAAIASTIAAVPAIQDDTRGLRRPDAVASSSGARSGSWASWTETTTKYGLGAPMNGRAGLARTTAVVRACGSSCTAAGSTVTLPAGGSSLTVMR